MDAVMIIRLTDADVPIQMGSDTDDRDRDRPRRVAATIMA